MEKQRNGIGRRKAAVTRVFLSKGEGSITVNDKDYKTYFPLVYLQKLHCKGAAQTMARGTILIADDDTAIRTVLNQALARAGYSPRATGNAATLWRWVSAGEGDVVITAVIMPDENAFDLIPRMKKTDSLALGAERHALMYTKAMPFEALKDALS